MPKAYPNRIREVRRQRKLSQEVLGEMVGCTNQQISNLENGRVQLTHDWLRRLAKALHCAPADFLAVSDTAAALALPSPVKAIADLLGDLSNAEQMAVLDVVEAVVKVIRDRKRGSPGD